MRSLVLAMILLGATLVAPAASGLPAATADATTGDYQQVVDLTFPFTEGTRVSYRDDYDNCRGSTCDRHHQSTDLMVAPGTPVHAALGGTLTLVAGSREGPASWGWALYVRGDDGRTYTYLHLGTQDGSWDEAYAPGIERGARVERGQLLGWAGCSGSATCGGGEHTHFEIHDNSVTDPYDYHDHERINPYWSLVEAERRGDYPNAPRFSDVPAGATHLSSILQLADSGVTRGCAPRRFCPRDGVTRAQMATFLVRALKLPTPSSAPSFTDVPSTHTHAASIAALAASGITRGCAPGRFCPEEVVTRDQMATFLVRARGLSVSSEGPGFSDVSQNSVHAGSIRTLAASGITRGCGPDRFCPSESVTREQMASFLVRAFPL